MVSDVAARTIRLAVVTVPIPPGPEIEGRVAHRDLLMRPAEVGWGHSGTRPGDRHAHHGNMENRG